jgi:hypothetical protein
VLVLHHCGPGTIPDLSDVLNRPSFDQTAGNCSVSYMGEDTQKPVATKRDGSKIAHSNTLISLRQDGVTQRKQLKYYLLYYSALKHHVGHLVINY